MKNHQSGSLLLELGFTMAVVGALSVSIMGGLGAIDQSRIASEQRLQMQFANESLKAFALKANRLPCPDLSGNGWEGNGSGDCPDSAKIGLLPYITLNMPMPAHGFALKYGVARISNGGDLARSTKPVASVSASSAFMTAAGVVAASPHDPAQPFVAGKDKDGRTSDCNSPSLKPAYALMFVNDAAAADDSLCFSNVSNASTEVSYMRREELLGWISAQLR